MSYKLDTIMSKDVIKLLIAEYQKQVATISFQKRPYYFEDNLNYVLIGLRRVGKSYLLYQHINSLLNNGHSIEEILYFNFEDDRIASLTLEDLNTIKICYEEMYECKPIFFFDEIQIVDHWEKFVRRLADQGFRVFVTGSNAKMLSSEIATTLGGRFTIQTIYPYSLQEFLTISGIDPTQKNTLYLQRTEIQRAFQTYFRFGGLPELPTISDKRAWLSSLYQKIFFGDLVSRYQIRNDFALKILIRKLAESIKQATSFNRLANIISSTGAKVSTDTVIDYLSYLNETWLILPIENIASRLVDKESNKKYYFIDNGILNLFLIDPNTSLLENMVAIQLCRLFGNDVFYYKSTIEVDFLVYSQKIAIQVAYSISDLETRNREIKALISMARHINIERMLIITMDEEEIIELENDKIEVLPLWKWLYLNDTF